MIQQCLRLALGALLAVSGLGLVHAKGRAIQPDDFLRFATVASPQVSPDGKWVAYTVSTVDRDRDESRTALWLASWDGQQQLQLTKDLKDVDSPRFSPDGRFIAFLATPAGAEKVQVMLLDRGSGETRSLTSASDGINSIAWSPDGKRLLLVQHGGMADDDGASAKPPKPIVIDAMHFKQDITGYVPAGAWKRLFLLDVESRKLEGLTSEQDGIADHPAWSPDSRRVAYVRTRSFGPDQDGREDIVLIDVAAGSTPQVLARVYSPNAQHLSWSPDGRQLAYLEGLEPRLSAYISDRLLVRPVAEGEAHLAAPALDRGILDYAWQSDGRAMLTIVEDDTVSYPARIDLRSGKVERLISGKFATIEMSSTGRQAAFVVSDDHTAGEVHVLDGRVLRRVTHHGDALLSELELGPVEDISFKSADGSEVHGLLVKPADHVEGHKIPTILWIHGGPAGHDEHSLPLDGYPLQFERQFLAAQGYAVLAINYRGSSGRGAKFQQAIASDWCHLEVEDLRAAVDYVISRGLADPERLGIGGWSYGGILTDCTIASDTRFKAAVSGAGSSNQLTMFGSDQYAQQYLNELGGPWQDLQPWLKVSYGFFHAERIKTPTLFLGGEKDFNVPIAGGEQMYQALRMLGIPTQLVVYPGQYHIFTRPSYIVDRAQRVREWYARYLK
ncbi:MAG: S9 family peptidase [Proteobacteria bacterium]|nr:S9 family peptidase [Pseudomonadota bacterium]